MALPSNIPQSPPTVKRINQQALVYELDGPQRPYPVYQFSWRYFWERPNANPFKAL